MTTKKERAAQHEKEVNEWRAQQAEIKRRRVVAKLKLEPEQIAALDETEAALAKAVNEIEEMNDLFLTTINKLVSAYWSLKNTFDLGENLIQEDND